VHNLVHIGLDFGGCNSTERLALHFRPNVPVTLCHAYCCARRPAENLRHDGNRYTLFEEFRSGIVPQIMEAQTLETRVAAGPPPGRSPVGDRTLKINMSVFASGKDKMFGLSIRNNPLRVNARCPVEFDLKTLCERHRVPLLAETLLLGIIECQASKLLVPDIWRVCYAGSKNLFPNFGTLQGNAIDRSHSNSHLCGSSLTPAFIERPASPEPTESCAGRSPRAANRPPCPATS
jgi:hypothetical protein